MQKTRLARRVSSLRSGRTSLADCASSHRLPRIIFNDDSDILRMVPPPHSVDSLNIVLDYLKGTPVDCLCWCVGEQQIAYSFASRAWQSVFDCMARIDPGPGRKWSGENDLMYSLHRDGIDYLPRLVQRAHDQGLMFVGSFRMNDTHIKSYPNGIAAPDFWRTHQHYRLWDAIDAKSYYNAALDYSFPEVRQRYRDIIAEVAERYDVDGIELDFTRSPYFFQPGEAWGKRAILTRFVREVATMLNKIGTKRGRPLTLILRVACRERALRLAGVDLQRWITERLAPILIISELVNNCNQSLEPWLSLCRKAGVLLYPAVEAGPAANAAPEFQSIQVRNPLAPRHDGQVRCSLEDSLAMRRAAAQNLLAQEPDGLATFNFLRAAASTTALLKEMGSLKTLAGTRKLFPFYKDLPIYVEANRPRRYHQTIPFAIRGKDIRNATVIVRFRWVAEKNPHADGTFRQNPIVKPGLVKVYLNDREIPDARLEKTKAPAGRIPSGFLLKSHQIVEFTVAGGELRNGVNTLAFEMPKFPEERDPYVYVYELAADVVFDAGNRKTETRLPK